jgi:hypothetical protein
VAQGLKVDAMRLRKDPDFASLGSRADFQTLLAELEARPKSGKQ